MTGYCLFLRVTTVPFLRCLFLISCDVLTLCKNSYEERQILAVQSTLRHASLKEDRRTKHSCIQYSCYLALFSSLFLILYSSGWKTTLLPDYLIKQVEVEIEQMTDLNEEPVMLFICQFNSVPGYLYKVQWFV